MVGVDGGERLGDGIGRRRCPSPFPSRGGGRRGGEEREIVDDGDGAGALPFFQEGEDGAGPRYDGSRKSGQFGDVDAVGMVGGAGR